MALPKNERILNLLFALMSTERYLTKEHIRQIIEAYKPLSDEAFERQFERDKEELRALGLPIETGTYDPFGNDDGYRINRNDIELPDIALSRAEAAVVALAGQVWQDSSMGDAVTTSLTKLKTIGIDVDTEAIPVLTPHIKSEGTFIQEVLEARHTRRPITFDYVDSQGQASKRKLQAWGLLNWQEHWYVGGFDLDRREPRIFRLSRIASKPKLMGHADSYEIPADIDLTTIADKMFGTGDSFEAVIQVRNGRAHTLRQRAVSHTVGEDADTLTIMYSDLDDIANEVCAFGVDAYVIEPAELREAVKSKLRVIAGIA